MTRCWSSPGASVCGKQSPSGSRECCGRSSLFVGRSSGLHHVRPFDQLVDGGTAIVPDLCEKRTEGGGQVESVTAPGEEKPRPGGADEILGRLPGKASLEEIVRMTRTLEKVGRPGVVGDVGFAAGGERY